MKRKTATVVAAVAVCLTAGAALSGCSNDSSTSGSTTKAKASASASSASEVSTASTTMVTKVMTKDVPGLGKILVDQKGDTLYLFAADTAGKSTCMSSCAKQWPAAVAKAAPSAAPDIRSSLVTTAARGTAKQVVVNKHPLYFFAGDTKPGQVNGQGLTAFGAKWWAVDPAGNKVTSKVATSSPSPTGSPTGSPTTSPGSSGPEGE